MERARAKKSYIFVSLIGLVVLFVIPLIYIDLLPDKIPMHYGADGTPDGFGSKSGIWFLPVLGAVLFGVMASLSHYLPSNPSDVKKLTEKQHQLQLDMTTHLLGTLMVVITISFVYIVYQTVRVALGEANGLGGGFLPLIIVAIFTPIIYFCWKMNTINKEVA